MKRSTGRHNGPRLLSSFARMPTNKRLLSSSRRHFENAQAERVETSFSPQLERRPVSPASDQPLLRSDNLFHPFSSSPLPGIRRRAAFIKRHAYCPHPDHHQTRLLASPNDRAARTQGGSKLLPARINHECPDCGIPVYCSEEHWADDYESHLEICELLRQINEDDHDLRSGRSFPEFEYAGPQMEEALVNLTNWDTLLYSRQFTAINDERSLRQATRLLTYPITIGSVLSELSPYNIRRGGRLTPEGLKSFSGNSYHSPFTEAC